MGVGYICPFLPSLEPAPFTDDKLWRQWTEKRGQIKPKTEKVWLIYGDNLRTGIKSRDTAVVCNMQVGTFQLELEAHDRSHSDWQSHN